MNRSEIIDNLRKIFPDGDYTDSLRIDTIGGMTNRNFKVTVNGSDYVLRIPGIGTDGMIERGNEEVNAMLACQIGITPSIRYYNKETGLKLTDYITDAETLNPVTVKHKDNLQAIAQILSVLHHSDIRLNNEFNYFREIEKYETLLKECGASMYKGWRPVREAVFKLNHLLGGIGIESCPCHNDLVPENFIKDRNGKLFLVDWEYSGTNDPFSDFAALFLESDFTEEESRYVLDMYFNGDIPPCAYTKTLAFQILQDYLWAIWTVIKEAKGDNFGDYGINRYNRAILNLKKLNLL